MASILRPSSKAVVLSDGLLLVTRNRSSRDPDGEWLLLPGGGQRPGEDLLATLRREVREETGIEVEPGRLLWVREYIPSNHEFAHFGDQEHAIECMFEAKVVGETQPPTEEDANQVGSAWVSPVHLLARRFYPRSLIGPITALARGGATDPVYLGDVN